MRILLVSLYGRGGMTHYASQLANALANDNEVTIVSPTPVEKNYFNARINFKLIKAPFSLVLSLFYALNIFAFLDLRD